MKIIYKSTLIISVLIMFLCSCTKAQENKLSIKKDNILIIYLSRTQNTKVVAEIIQQKVGGDLMGLELENPYPANYKLHVEQVTEENQNNFMPQLKNKIDNMEKYDVIFIGFPTWGMQLPPPFKTFLKQYDFSNKTIIPFNTNAGYGVGNSFKTIKQLAPKSKILDGLVIEGGKERDGILFVMEGKKYEEVLLAVQEWLNRIQI